MTTIAIAMAIQVAIPAEISAIADTRPEAIARSARELCTGQLCDVHTELAVEGLSRVWTGFATDNEDRAAVLDSIRNATTERGTDWIAAQRAFGVWKQARIHREAEASAPAFYERMNRETRRRNGYSRVTTTCRTSGGVYSASTTCTTETD